MGTSVTKTSSFYTHTLVKVLQLDPTKVGSVRLNIQAGAFPTATVELVLSDEQLAAIFRNDSTEA